KWINGVLGTVCAVSASAVYANSCGDQFTAIQQGLFGGPFNNGSLSSSIRSNVQTLNSMSQASSALRQALNAPIAAPQFAQDLSNQVAAARAENQHAREALFNANSLIVNDFEQEYQKALAMVCQGHCSPGITDALNQLRAIARNALSNVSASSN